jgi:peptide chain release factor 2
MRRRQELDQQIAMVLRLERSIDENVELIELGELEGDQGIVADAEAVLQAMRPEVAKQELQTLLSGEADANDCYVEIHAGAGGTESQDWASMLLRMYVRWAEAHRYKVEFIEEHGRRHTSFASVWVFPMVDDTIDVEVNESDCRIDTYRASGAGGQHVNTTDSAVRITHLPTGIVVSCQNERSQHKNRATAWNMLKARLYELELQKRQEKIDAANAGKSDIGWGHQIRSYVLQPYQLVKDLRTGVTSTNPSAVLDGDLDDFMAASLAHRVHGDAAVADVGDID